MTEAELSTLAGTHDIIRLGVVADDLRRQRHGAQTTFVRVADISSDVGAPVAHPPAAGELRITGAAASRAAAVSRVGEAASAANGAAVSGFSLADLGKGATFYVALPKERSA